MLSLLLVAPPLTWAQPAASSAPSSVEVLVLTGKELTLADVFRVACEHAVVEADRAALDRLKRTILPHVGLATIGEEEVNSVEHACPK